MPTFVIPRILLVLRPGACPGVSSHTLDRLIGGDHPSHFSRPRPAERHRVIPLLLGDGNSRLRSTSYWVILGFQEVDRIRGVGVDGASILLHVLNSWLVLAVVLVWRRPVALATWAGFFFAIHVDHQEAVMWFTAVAWLWCCLRGRERTSVVLSAPALLYKESAMIFLPLFLLTTERSRWKRLPAVGRWMDRGRAAIALAAPTNPRIELTG